MTGHSRRRIVRAATASAIAVAVAGAVIGVEVELALQRQYLSTAPALTIGGFFGPPDGKPLRFAVLGDSTAAGLGAGSADRSYPWLLASRLGDAGYRVELVDFGVSGARTRDVALEQAPEAVKVKPDLVLVAIGGNDVTHLTRLPSVRRDMHRALRQLRTTGAALVATGVPDMRAHAFAQPLRAIAGWRGRIVSGALEGVIESEGVRFVPLAERTGHFFAEDPDGHFSSDLFHPGPGGYRRWADAIYPELVRVLAPAPGVPAPAPTPSPSRTTNG